MQQLEFKFFYPLTEQISLDLDYTPCEDYTKSLSKPSLTTLSTTLYASDGLYSTTSSTLTIGKYNSAGSIEITPDFHVHVNHKPNWLARFSMKKIFGWNWKDK